MTPPIQISADFESRLILVRYRRLSPGTRVEHDDQVAPGATAGVDADGNVVAIELLSVEPATLAAAQRYAHEHGLAFPRDLSRLLEAA